MSQENPGLDLAAGRGHPRLHLQSKKEGARKPQHDWDVGFQAERGRDRLQGWPRAWSSR